MKITIRNANDAQARRTFERITKFGPGWTHTADRFGEYTIAINGFASASRISAKAYEADRYLYDEDGQLPGDVLFSSAYYTLDSMLDALTPAMRERAEIDGQPADEYRSAMRAKYA
jgi:hypothetical protein